MPFDPGVSEVQVAASLSTDQAAQAKLTESVPVKGAAPAVNPGTANFSTVGEFKKNFPEFFEKFMDSWCLQAVNEAKHGNDRLIEAMKEARRQNS